MSDRKLGDIIESVGGGAKVSGQKYRVGLEVCDYEVGICTIDLVPFHARTLAADLIHFANLIDAQEEG